mmetsp:Transcript_7663/g.20133  ORF Transcript_7663/g.20133 Transcript_7663/m.20133 type:complete len:229 (+) Transcript_7663:496-1182(+)
MSVCSVCVRPISIRFASLGGCSSPFSSISAYARLMYSLSTPLAIDTQEISSGVMMVAITRLTNWLSDCSPFDRPEHALPCVAIRLLRMACMLCQSPSSHLHVIQLCVSVVTGPPANSSSASRRGNDGMLNAGIWYTLLIVRGRKRDAISCPRSMIIDWRFCTSTYPNSEASSKSSSSCLVNVCAGVGTCTIVSGAFTTIVRRLRCEGSDGSPAKGGAARTNGSRQSAG